MQLKALAFPFLALPLAAQAWDLRLEVPFPSGQNLPQTLVGGTADLVRQKSLDTGKGYTFTVSHRIVRMGPVLKLEWGGEFSRWQADGAVQVGSTDQASKTRQYGLGVGVNAQFWVPFTGLAGELGAIARYHDYRYEVAGAAQDERILRPWLRAGLRYRLPLWGVNPYLAASYQQPITKDKPVRLSSASDLAAYLSAQGAGQEFERLWTFGVGISF